MSNTAFSTISNSESEARYSDTELEFSTSAMKDKPPFIDAIPRSQMTMDGNQAAVHVAYAYSEAAAIYPITPSSPMAELCDEWAAAGRKNIYGKTMLISQLQSEAGAAGAMHGALAAGALATTFTASQGLLLMLPNIYRMAGELLPGVIHVAARTIATHALSIFGDHSDIYACRQTGAAIFCTSSVQEVMDLAPVAHLAALEGRIPFLHFFDGFRTSHELHKIKVWDYDTLKSLANPKQLADFRARSLHPTHGKIYGSAQNPDIFFQTREASNPYYQALPHIVEGTLARINKLLETNYGLFDYYGAPDAEHVVIAMGSICETVKEYIDSVPDKKYGLISVHLYRPFSAKHLLAALPQTVKQITVLDRTKEPGAPGEPLYLDVVAALAQAGSHCPSRATQGIRFEETFGDEPSAKTFRLDTNTIKILSGRYGLSSKDTTPAQIAAVYANTTQTPFTIGITDDVTHLSLPIPQIAETAPKDIISCKFWGLGGDGTVSATKNAIKIIGDHTELNAQGYFEYDSKKSRGLTISHLRFGKSSIHSTYLIHRADFVACHNPVYLHKYEMAEELKDGGTFLVNFHFPLDADADSDSALLSYLPSKLIAYLQEHQIHLYVIDALAIGKEIGLNNKISTILQAAFFAVSSILKPEDAKGYMMKAAEKSYGKMGDKILRMNHEAIDRGFREVREVQIPVSYKSEREDSVTDTPHPLDNEPLPDRAETLAYVKNIQQPSTDQRGDTIPVSAFLPYADGLTPPGTTAHERRNTATELPHWIPENCIQCNQCSFVCPHAVIRPAVLNQEQLQNAPKGMETIPMNGMPDHNFAIAISEVDCTGCGSCVAVCPGKMGNKALVMEPAVQAVHTESCCAPASANRQSCFDYCKPLLPCHPAAEKFNPATPKGSQFLRPLMEFSGACAGCGETPYVKLLTQLFGPRMYIANATGCSTIWANSSPSCAYTVDENGHGPAWSNSLFEDGAEFGYGMWMAQEVIQSADKETDTIQWIIGGDGWAYDIGFGGLDHVLASGKNINILVLDTEVYSNTGGQASKATPLGSTAKFVSGGKKTAKKNLAAIAMTYGNVYVAQIAMGASFAQTVQAFTEAAAYPGPSLIIAYATCIAHGIRAGLGSTSHEEKKAVDAGYFHLFRFNPSLREQGKNPFRLDSKEPTLDYEEFLNGEIRYDSLKRYKPEEAKELFEEASARAKEKYRYLRRLEALYEPGAE